MGCGKSKSKQDVATGNTVVTTRKNSLNNDDNADESKRGGATGVVEILPENSTTTVMEENVKNEKVESVPEVKEEITKSIETLDNQEKQATESTLVIDHVDDVVTNKDVAAVAVEEEVVESDENGLICRDSPSTFFSSPKIHHGEASGRDEATRGPDMSLDFESPRHDFPVAEESATIVNESSAKEQTVETPVAAAEEEKGAIVVEEIIEATESKN